MAKKVKKMFRTMKGALFADPKLLYKEEMHLLNQSFKFPGTVGASVSIVTVIVCGAAW